MPFICARSSAWSSPTKSSRSQVVFGYGFEVGVSIYVCKVADKLFGLGVEPFAEAVDAVEVLVECSWACVFCGVGGVWRVVGLIRC